MKTGKAPVVLAGVLALAAISGGCATKKHVREAIAPVQQQVNDVQKQTNDNKTAIGDLDRQVATADEKATDAGKRAGQAMDAATSANNAATAANGVATQAGQRADAANTAAQGAQSNITRLEANLANYKLVDTKQVFFKIGRSNLEADSQAQLDAAIQALANMKAYVIEVEGFADKTGNKAMNVELSRKRADSVVRYLTVDHNVPLRDIRQLGVGADFPNAVNKTRDERKENRRVDVKIWVLDTTGTANQAGSQTAAPNPSTARPNQ